MKDIFSKRARKRVVFPACITAALGATFASAVAPVAFAQSAVSDSSPRWAYDEDTDAITDQTGAIAAIKSLDGQTMLAFQCDHTTDGSPMLFQLRFPERKYFGPRPTVSIRVDKARPLSFDWHAIAKAVVVWRADQVTQVARALSGGGHVYLRALDSDDQAVDAEFRMDRSVEVFAKVMRACGKPEKLISDMTRAK